MFRIINIVQTKIVYIIHNRALKNKKYSIFYKKQKRFGGKMNRKKKI